MKGLLIDQIESRVKWRESVINMINNGVDHFIEIGPGKVLSGLVKRINKDVKINTPSKAPSAYTKAELLTLMDKPHWDDMFNKKYAYHIASQPVITKDTSFDVSTLNDS